MGRTIKLEVTFDELCVLELALWRHWQIELSKNKVKYESDIEFAKELDYKLMTLRNESVSECKMTERYLKEKANGN